jgi:hypothetical protein
MKVVLQTPSELVVHDGRWPTVLAGFVFFSAGAGFIALRVLHPQGWSGNGGAWVVYVVGGAFALLGIALFAFSADRRYVFDKSTKVATLTVQRLVHRQVRQYPFADIADVVLEKSAGVANSGSNASRSSADCWRPVFLMKDGGRVPWMPYSTSEYQHQAATAAAVRAFGGWAAEAARPATAGAVYEAAATLPPPADRAPPLMAHPVAMHWGLLGFFLSLFVAVGIGIFGLEVYRVLTWRAVEATILSSDIKTVRGSKGNSYAPQISYSYSYEGAQYVGAGVMPVSMSASLGWAESLRARFQRGSVVAAYVNPGRPASAFLVRRVSLLPLLFVVMPIGFGALFAWIIRTQRNTVALEATHPVPEVSA